MTAAPTTNARRTGPSPLMIIVAGCLIAAIGFGVRSSFGLFLEPMTLARGWDRETFGLALAIQNLLWGVGVPISGMLADKFGPSRVMILGAGLYALGVWGMASADTSLGLHMFAGIVTGLGVAFTSFSLALASMARVVGPEKRSAILGLGTAAGSAGQVFFSPIGQGFIDAFGWQPALYLLAASTLLVIPLALMMPRASASAVGELVHEQSMAQALREAAGHRGFKLLTLGFFVCGFHVAFISVHFPAYIRDQGLSAQVGAYALALIGLFNIAGSIISGYAGQRWSKKSGLSALYLARAIAITALLLLPKTAITIYVFSAVMGFLWLSTVPLTTGIIAQVFGLRYMATLFGVVFFSHQLGSFSGVWLGGYLYDTRGSYDAIWWAGVALGLLAAFIHLPINERPLARLAKKPT
ncbi:MAG: MFS transporter [Alphaproteobacteria bacterium]